jgi:Fe-S cluster assembly iron-binding protein IscA
MTACNPTDSPTNELLKAELNKKKNLPTDSDKIATKVEEANKTYYRIAGLLFTEFAYDTLHDMLEDLNGLQIRLDAGGCSGYSYTYDFTNQPQPDEATYPMSDKLYIYMNDFTFDKLYGTVVDFKI